MRLGNLTLLGVLTLIVACSASSTEPTADPDTKTPPTGIHPQPQPNKTETTFTSPCNAEKCGDVPTGLKKPRCKPQPTGGTGAEPPSGCGWSDDTTVSYAPCEESKCGTAPGPETCPPGTTFKGNACGSENNAACAWNTVCAPPPSTTPCKNAEGCGPKPEIGVICKDGSTGDLACMQFDDGCKFQRTCD